MIELTTQHDRKTTVPKDCFIDEWRAASDGGSFDVEDPRPAG